MFTLVKNYKNLFGMCLASYQEAPGMNTFDDNKDGVIDATEVDEVLSLPEAKLATNRARLEQFGTIINFAKNNLKNDIKFDNSSSSAEYKTLQVLCKYIGKSAGVELKNTSIDGKFGPNSQADLKSILGDAFAGNILTGNGISELLSKADSTFSVMEAQVQKEADNIQMNNALDAIKTDKNAVKAVQQALVDAGVTLPGRNNGVDGSLGEGTKKAAQENRDVVLAAIAKYIKESSGASVKERVKTEASKDAKAIDEALSTLSEQSTDEELIAIANKFTAKELGGDVRNANAQYISLKLQDMGIDNKPFAQKLMEKVMAEGKGHYEQETREAQILQALDDSSWRFARRVGSFPENFSGSYHEIQNALQNKGERSRLLAGMNEGMTGTADEIVTQLFGVGMEYLATRMHVVTGKGKDGDADMSLVLGNGMQLSNAYYDEKSGAIYAVVAKGNGCEGNLVVIPVETFLVPKVIKNPTSRPTKKPVEKPTEPGVPTTPDTPETGRQCRLLEECRNGKVWKRQYCWDAGTMGRNPSFGEWYETNETCGGGGGDHPSGHNDTSNPGTEGGSDNGGGDSDSGTQGGSGR